MTGILRFTLKPLALILLVMIGISVASADQPPVRLETLMKTPLALDENIELTISYVEIGPDLSLPKHYHPGEEYVYLLEGEATLWQQGKADTPMTAGQVVKIPLEQVHAASTGGQVAKALVFRVHRKGEPERVLVPE